MILFYSNRKAQDPIPMCNHPGIQTSPKPDAASTEGQRSWMAYQCFRQDKKLSTWKNYALQNIELQHKKTAKPVICYMTSLAMAKCKPRINVTYPFITRSLMTKSMNPRWMCRP